MATRYDDSLHDFAPFDPHEWIYVDDGLLAALDEKDRLAERTPRTIFMAEPDTQDAQEEALAMLAHHLPQRYPDIYQRLGPQIDIIPAFRRVRLDQPYPPLLIAGGLVQEDVVILRRGDEGWRQVAAHLCFTPSWRLEAGLASVLDYIRTEQPLCRWSPSQRERQTFLKLPVSGDVLLTIRTYAAPSWKS